MTDTTLDQRRRRRLERAFREEELAGLKLATQARLITLIVIALWLRFGTTAPHAALLNAILVVFALVGIAHYALARSRFHRSWQTYLFIVFDFALLTLATIGLDLLFDDDWPTQMALRRETILYFFSLLALLTLSYTPRLMLWAGLSAVATWSVGVALILALPDTLNTTGHGALSPQAHVAAHLDPRFLNPELWLQEVIVLLLAAGVLACVVWRGKRLVQRQATVERERANLSRYFSPNMVDELAGHDKPLGAVRSQPVAVLFADIVGFTQVCEALAPEIVIGLLREFHGRMANAVFAHSGTVDKYIGDAIMATFGTPHAGPRDAHNGLAAARAMVAAMADWNRERWQAGRPPIGIGIGLHFGPAVMGDIGGERRLEFAVIGDTVNVASRLEALTRGLGVDIVASEDLVRKVREEGGQILLDGFVPGELQRLHNRQAPVRIWTWRDAA